MEKLIIGPTVGYMLKVMKSGKDITKFESEFAAIRHGNYDEFIDLIKEEKPFMVAWQDGVISTQDNISQKTHCDFAGLVLAKPSLTKFFNNCVKEYGKDLLKTDTEISNDIYEKMALFELSLRMHANNNKLLNEHEDLDDVIKKLCKFKNIPPSDEEKLHKGRRFINDIKHHNEPSYKRKFLTWSEGVLNFEEAYKLIEDKKLTII